MTPMRQALNHVLTTGASVAETARFFSVNANTLGSQVRSTRPAAPALPPLQPVSALTRETARTWRAAGYTYREIGCAAGVTRQRAQQLCSMRGR
jgi:transposase-like protein